MHGKNALRALLAGLALGATAAGAAPIRNGRCG